MGSRDACSSFMKSRGGEGPRQEKEGSREPFPASWCHLTVPPSPQEGRGGKWERGCLDAFGYAVSHNQLLPPSQDSSVTPESQGQSMPRIGTCPRVAGSSVALTSRGRAGDHVCSIFAMPMGREVGFTPGPMGMAWHLPTSQAGCEFMADSHTPELPSSGLLRPASSICGQPYEHRLSSTWPFRALWGFRAQSGESGAKPGPL